MWVQAQAPLGAWQYLFTVAGALSEGMRVTFGSLLPLKHHLVLHAAHLASLLPLAPVVCSGIVHGSATARLVQGLGRLGPQRLVVALLTRSGVLPAASADAPALAQQCEATTAYLYFICWFAIPTVLLVRYEKAWRMRWLRVRRSAPKQA